MNYQPRGVLIQLERFEVDFAILVARKRTFENRRKPHIYKSVWKLEPQHVAELAGVLCEMAVAKHLDRYWGSLAWQSDEHSKYSSHVADVGTDNRIEVRRIKQPEYALRYWKKDLDGNKRVYIAYCPTVPSLPQTTHVDVIAWGDVRDLEKVAVADDNGSFRVAQNHLYAIEPMDWSRIH